MTTIILSSGLPAIEIKPFCDTREGVASLLTVSLMQTRDTIHADAEYIRTNGDIIGVSVMLWDCTCDPRDMLDLLYRIERLLNNKSIIMLSSVFRVATRNVPCSYSLYSVSPDFQWEGILPDGIR